MRVSSTALCFLLLSTAMAAVPRGVAMAAPPDQKPDASLTDKARDLFNEGVSLFKKGEYGRARASFLAAWALKKHYQVGARLGECELKLGMHRDAAEHLAFGIREAVRLGEDVGTARKLLEEAKAKIGALEIRVSEAGAEVLVDGVVVGSAPLSDPVFVEPGKHTVEARLEAKRAKVEVDAAMGATVPVQLTPTAPAPAPARAKGSGEKSPAPPLPTTPAEQPLAPIVIGGSVAMVGLAVGIGFTVAANGKSSDADALAQPGHSACATDPKPGPCAPLQGALEDLDTFTDAAVAAYVVGGIAAIGTAVYALWPRSTPTGTSGTAVIPWVGASSGGMIVGGSF